MCVHRIIDLLAERNSLPGAQAEQVTRGQCADHVACLIDDAEVAGLETVHAADCSIDERVIENRSQRPARDLFDRQIERGGAEPVDRR